MHGYGPIEINGKEDQNALFLIHSYNETTEIKTTTEKYINFVDILPSLLKLLKIDSNLTFDGKSFIV